MGDSGGPSESQVGDDPATFDDEGVGYGNINTTTEQALSDDPSIDDDFSAADAAAARAEIQNQLETQAQVDSFQQMQDQKVQEKIAQQQAFAQQQADKARQSLQDTIEEERGMAGELTLADLTPNVTATIPTTPTVLKDIFRPDDFSKATDDRTITQRGDIQKQTLENLLNVTPNVKNMMRGQTDASDFNIAGSKAAADLRERAKGSLSPTMQGMLPFGNLINTLTGLPAQRTLDALNRGEVPDFQNMKDGQIQGTTGKGFGADQTEGYIGGLSINAPGAPGGLNTLPIPNFVEPEETTDDGGETVKKAPPKAPTDPCPEGYQLIDGKCTLMEKPVDEGTGFIRFPTDRDPPFQKGPFTPATVATDPKNITPLNPVTFRLSDIFRT